MACIPHLFYPGKAQTVSTGWRLHRFKWILTVCLRIGFVKPRLISREIFQCFQYSCGFLLPAAQYDMTLFSYNFLFAMHSSYILLPMEIMNRKK